MTTRFCPGCQADVEDTGGFCLLGHRLALDPPVASLSELRAEVDRSFDDAGLEAVDGAQRPDDLQPAGALDEAAGLEQVDGLQPALAGARVDPITKTSEGTAGTAPQPSGRTQVGPPAPRRAGPPPPPPPATPARAPKTGDVSLGFAAKVPPPPPTVLEAPTAPDVPTGFAPSPAAPVTPPRPRPETKDMWAALEVETDLDGDPITSFAPSPRMDWGPAKGRLRRLSRRSRKEANPKDSKSDD